MPDVLDRLQQLVPDEAEIRLGPAWTAVRRRTVRDARRRRAATVVGAAAMLAVCAVFVGRIVTHQDEAQITTTEPSTEGLVLEPGWNPLPTLPIEPRVDPALAELPDGDLFLWGGTAPEYLGEPLRDGAVLDAETARWDVLPPAPEELYRPVASVVGELVVLVRSDGSAPFTPLIWDPATSTWSVGAEGPTGCFAEGRAATDHELFLRCEDASFVGYHPGRDEWRSLPPAPIDYTAASLVWTGEVLVAFGRTESFAVPAGDGTAVVFDPTTETWGEHFRVPISGQATATTWTGDEVVVLDYDMSAAAFDPHTRSARALPPVPLRFYECSPQAFSVGGRAVAGFCSGAAVLGPDDRWTPFAGPDGSTSGWYGGTGGSAIFTTAHVLTSDPASSPTELDGRPFAYLPPAPDADGHIPAQAPVPLGISTFTPPEGASVVSSTLDEQSTVTAISHEVVIDGASCQVSSTYAPFRRLPLGTTATVIEVADGSTRDGWRIQEGDDEPVSLRWTWSDDLFTDEQQAVCPTEELARLMAQGFHPPR